MKKGYFFIFGVLVCGCSLIMAMDTTAFQKSHSDGEFSPKQSPKVQAIKRSLKRSKSEVIDPKAKAVLVLQLASLGRVKALEQAYKQDPDANMITHIKNVLTRSQSVYSRSQDEDPSVVKGSKHNMISQLIAVPNDEK